MYEANKALNMPVLCFVSFIKSGKYFITVARWGGLLTSWRHTKNEQISYVYISMGFLEDSRLSFDTLDPEG